MNRLDFLVGTLGGAGKSPVGPGTVGSVAALLPLLLIPDPWYGVGVFVLILLAWPLSLRTARRFIAARGDGDPQDFVLDEGIGLWIACWRPVASSPWGLLFGFLFFRLFDILKPGPVGRAERLPGARGVVYDDVVAGFLALPLSWAFEIMVLRFIG